MFHFFPVHAMNSAPGPGGPDRGQALAAALVALPPWQNQPHRTNWEGRLCTGGHEEDVVLERSSLPWHCIDYKKQMKQSES